MRGARGSILLLLALVLWATGAAADAQQPAHSGALHGFVREAGSGEPVASALVVVDGQVRAYCDRSGYFAFPRLTAGVHRVRVEALGYAPADTTLTTGGGTAPVELLLSPAPIGLEAVTVQGAGGERRPLGDPAVSATTITSAQVREVPAALEEDLFRSIQALPGVTASSVLSGRLLVRGGSSDQNLFLLDGYPVVNPYHLGGAFSAFNVDAVQDAELFLGAPPARYGGRLSSVLDVKLRDGNREKLSGSASLGVVSSSAMLEGPHAKGAWFVGVRRTYLDFITNLAGHIIPYYFYDAYAKSYADLTPSDRLSVLAFFGRDRVYDPTPGEPTVTYVISHDDELHWSNGVFGVSWRHLFGARAVLEQRASLSGFGQTLRGGGIDLYDAGYGSEQHVRLGTLDGELRLDLAPWSRLAAGYSAERRGEHHVSAYVLAPTAYELEPPRYERRDSAHFTTLAGYLQDDISLGHLRAQLGLRGEQAGRYRSLQPRLSAAYLLTPRVALTAGAGVIRQYDHQMLDPDVKATDVVEQDIWLSAQEPGVPASRATHLLGGVDADIPLGLRLRAQGYWKRFDGLMTIAPYDYLLRVPAIARLQEASGVARGLDLSLGREGEDDVRGWVGYSLASSRRTVDGFDFPADFPPRQRFVAVLDVKRNDLWRLTAHFDAQEGVPYTPVVELLPWHGFDVGTGRFTQGCSLNGDQPLLGQRNSARVGWSKRLDVGAHRRWKNHRGWHWDLAFSILNLLADPDGAFLPEPATDDLCFLGGSVPPDWRQPVPVGRRYPFIFPPIPSLSIRLEF